MQQKLFKDFVNKLKAIVEIFKIIYYVFNF